MTVYYPGQQYLLGPMWACPVGVHIRLVMGMQMGPMWAAHYNLKKFNRLLYIVFLKLQSLAVKILLLCDRYLIAKINLIAAKVKT